MHFDAAATNIERGQLAAQTCRQECVHTNNSQWLRTMQGLQLCPQLPLGKSHASAKDFKALKALRKALLVAAKGVRRRWRNAQPFCQHTQLHPRNGQMPAKLNIATGT